MIKFFSEKWCLLWALYVKNIFNHHCFKNMTQNAWYESDNIFMIQGKFRNLSQSRINKIRKQRCGFNMEKKKLNITGVIGSEENEVGKPEFSTSPGTFISCREKERTMLMDGATCSMCGTD